MARPYSRALLRIAVAQICQNLGWNAVQTTPMELLTDVMERYLLEIGKFSHRYAEQFGRVEPNLDDLGLVFQDMGISLDEMDDYVQHVDPVPFALDVPKYPVPKDNLLHFPKPNSRDLLHREEHIDPHYPPINPDLDEELELPQLPVPSTPLPVVSAPPEPAPPDDSQLQPGPVTGEKRVNSSPSEAQPPAKRLRPLPEEAGHSKYEMKGVKMLHSGQLLGTQGIMPDASTPPPPTPGTPLITKLSFSTSSPAPGDSKIFSDSEEVIDVHSVPPEDNVDSNVMPPVVKTEVIPTKSPKGALKKAKGSLKVVKTVKTAKRSGKSPKGEVKTIKVKTKKKKLTTPKVPIKAPLFSSPINIAELQKAQKDSAVKSKGKVVKQQKGKSPKRPQSPRKKKSPKGSRTPGLEPSQRASEISQPGAGSSVLHGDSEKPLEPGYSSPTIEAETEVPSSHNLHVYTESVEAKQSRLTSYDDAINSVMQYIPVDVMPNVPKEVIHLEPKREKPEQEAPLDLTFTPPVDKPKTPKKKKEKKVKRESSASLSNIENTINDVIFNHSMPSPPAPPPGPPPPPPPPPVTAPPPSTPSEPKVPPLQISSPPDVYTFEDDLTAIPVKTFSPLSQETKKKVKSKKDKKKRKSLKLLGEVSSIPSGEDSDVSKASKTKVASEMSFSPTSPKIVLPKLTPEDIKQFNYPSPEKSMTGSPVVQAETIAADVTATPPPSTPGSTSLIMNFKISKESEGWKVKKEKKKKKNKDKDKERDRKKEKNRDKDKKKDKKDKDKKDKDNKDKDKKEKDKKDKDKKDKDKKDTDKKDKDKKDKDKKDKKKSLESSTTIDRPGVPKLTLRFGGLNSDTPTSVLSSDTAATPPQKQEPLKIVLSSKKSKPVATVTPPRYVPSPSPSPPPVLPSPSPPPTRSPSPPPTRSPSPPPTCSPSPPPTRSPSPPPTRSPSPLPTRSPSPDFSPARSPDFSPARSPDFSPVRSRSPPTSLSPSPSPLSKTHQPPFMDYSFTPGAPQMPVLQQQSPIMFDNLDFSPSPSPPPQIEIPLSRSPTISHNSPFPQDDDSAEAPERSPSPAETAPAVEEEASEMLDRLQDLDTADENEESEKSPAIISETIGTVQDENGETIWICPACKMQDDGSPMVGCDKCDDWYHWLCVGLKKAPPKEQEWYCPRCRTEAGKLEKKRRPVKAKPGRKKVKKK